MNMQTDCGNAMKKIKMMIYFYWKVLESGQAGQDFLQDLKNGIDEYLMTYKITEEPVVNEYYAESDCEYMRQAWEKDRKMRLQYIMSIKKLLQLSRARFAKTANPTCKLKIERYSKTLTNLQTRKL